MSVPMLEAALAYIAEGFRVFPVKPDKKPLTEHGLKDATQLHQGVRDYWGKWPDAGIGLVTDGFIVVDFDVKNGGLESKATIEAKYGELPRTKTHRTGGGGLHYIYRNPNGTNVRNTVALGGYQGVDLRANGGYIVAPPSLHESGARYEVLDACEIAPAPEWLVTMAIQKNTTPLSAGSTGEPIPDGQRNATLASLAGTMRRRGMTEAEITVALLEVNRRSQPPKTEDEVRRIAKSIARYKPAEQDTKAGKPAQARFHLTKLSDLLNEPDEDIAYLWENTLIKGGLSILVAKPKVGKSTLARNLALMIAKGESSFLGRNITGSGPVVYLALEEKRSEVKKHFVRMGATENLPIFIHTGSAPEQAITELRKAVIESNALLAIVDPLQRLVRIPDLNDYSSVSLALEPLMQIARDTGCHILLIHHANKGIARDGGDSILGSTAIFGSVDCALIMKRGESYRTIESIQRYGEDLPRTVLTFDAVTGLTGSGGSLEGVEVAECGKAIIELMADHEMSEREVKEGITDYKGGTVSKSLRLLCQEGKIQRQGLGKKGDPYLYIAVPKNAGDADLELFDNKNDFPFPTTEAVLGMPVEKVIELWCSEGAPVIHLGPGENCLDLAKLLSNPDVSERHLKAIRAWLDKVLQRRGGSNDNSMP